MKNKKGNVAMIAIIIVIVAITASVITWLVATKKQTTSQQTTTQPTSPPHQSQQSISTSQQDTVLPIINLNKFTKKETGKTINHVAVEYKKNINDNKKIIHDFTYENNPNMDFEYKVSYLTQNYLVIQRCGGMAPCSDYLFDIKNLQPVKFQFPTLFGSVSFFENEKYITVSGPGRIEQPGIAIEIIDSKKIYCLISGEEVSDANVNNGVMSFTEYALVEDKDDTVKDVITKKEINIAEFCKNK